MELPLNLLEEDDFINEEELKSDSSLATNNHYSSSNNHYSFSDDIYDEFGSGFFL